MFLFYPSLSSWVNFLRLENLIHSFHIMSQNDKILQRQFHEPVKSFYEDGLKKLLIGSCLLFGTPLEEHIRTKTGS